MENGRYFVEHIPNSLTGLMDGRDNGMTHGSKLTQVLHYVQGGKAVQTCVTITFKVS